MFLSLLDFNYTTAAAVIEKKIIVQIHNCTVALNCTYGSYNMIKKKNLSEFVILHLPFL